MDILIDNGDARVSIRQIFGNRTGSVLEGNYIFALPSRGLVSDFAVWDDVTRIPGVILERRRAEEIYDSLPAIHRSRACSSKASAKPAKPAAARCSARASCPFRRSEPSASKSTTTSHRGRESGRSEFALPLRPSAYRAQAAGRLVINLELRSGHAIRNFDPQGKLYPLRIIERDAHLVKAAFEGQNVSLGEDFAVRYEFDSARADTLDVITYRDPAGQ